jgi:gluconate 2-dehydrogenase gamma chain
MNDTNPITRREALARTALLLGGTLAASTIAGAERAVWAATPGWRPRTLSAQESEMVATMAEHIIPATDTPGGRAAGVHRLVDVLLTDYYSPAERNRFLAGLRAVNIRAIREHGAPFLRCAPREQVELLTALDAEAYSPKQVVAQVTPQGAEAQRMSDSLSRSGSTIAGSVQPPSAAVDGMPEEMRRELRSGWFFRRLKELSLLGYYTSEVGATKELRVSPMGAYHGDVPFRTLGRTWA